jgi:hypothetical protein
MFPLSSLFNNGRVLTSSRATTRRNDLRDDLIERDQTCILTRVRATRCDAAHLVSRSKGDEVRYGYPVAQHAVIFLRSQ